jgi:Zn2+/Cd2+-exporting ATPase
VLSQGVLIKGGSHLEALGRVRFVSFDKSGTLTEGSFRVMHMEALNGFVLQDVLTLAGSLEQAVAHPLAPAIVGAAASAGCLKR